MPVPTTAADAPEAAARAEYFAGAAERPTGVRYGVLVLLALAMSSAYLTRICLSTANTTIQREFGISNEQMGDIMGAFFLGYFAFQLPTGWMGKRYGARLTMALLSVAASACSVWSGLSVGPVGLWCSRLGLGVAQAGVVPCGSRVVVDWFPTPSRGKASAVVTASMSLGAVIASGLTAALLPHLGWRGVFFAYSSVGVVWAAAHFLFFRDVPEQHRAVNGAERRLIRELPEGPPGEDAPIPPKPAPSPTWAERRQATGTLLGAMVTSSSAWLLCGQAFFRAFGAAFFLTWFPAFLEKGHHVKLQDTGFLAMLPLAGSVVGALVGGVVVDVVLKRTGSKRLSRSGTAAAALTVTALCSLAATFAPSPVAMVLILSLGSFCFGLGSPSSWAASMDISGEHTQTVMAIQNMVGNAAAFLCPKAVGWLFDYIEKNGADWNLVLYVFVGMYAAGALCWAFLNPNRSAVERRTAACG
jgi:MFS family permease